MRVGYDSYLDLIMEIRTLSIVCLIKNLKANPFLTDLLKIRGEGPLQALCQALACYRAEYKWGRCNRFVP